MQEAYIDIKRNAPVLWNYYTGPITSLLTLKLLPEL